MSDFLAAHILWFKALHIISVIYWMAGMFMLPRYFAYHAECAPGSEEDRKWQARERKILRIIINPSMIAAFLFGGLLMHGLGVVPNWLWLKLAVVSGLLVLHHLLARWRKEFERGENRRSSRFYRMVNEIPSLSVIVIVILAVIKPF